MPRRLFWGGAAASCAALTALLLWAGAGARSGDTDGQFEEREFGTADFMELTGTARGDQLKADASARYSELGIRRNLDADRVVQIGSEDAYVILPKALELSAVKIRGNDRERTVTSSFSLRSPMAPATVPTARRSLTSYWQWWDGGCPLQFYGDWSSYMATCYTVYRLVDDGNPSADYWELSRRASFKAGTGWMDYAWVESDENGGASQSWVDWDPGSDSSGNCSTMTVSVSYVIGISENFSRCEDWDITWWSDPAHFRVEWDGWAYNLDRELGGMALTSVAQGGYPAWVITAEYRACYYNFCDTRH